MTTQKRFDIVCKSRSCAPDQYCKSSVDKESIDDCLFVFLGTNFTLYATIISKISYYQLVWQVLHLRGQLHLLKRCQENKIDEDLGAPLS